MLGKSPSLIYHAIERNLIRTSLSETLQNTGAFDLFRCIYRNIPANGRLYYKRSSVEAMPYQLWLQYDDDQVVSYSE